MCAELTALVRVMTGKSFVHLRPLPDMQEMEAPSKALHEKREAWVKANLDKPARDLLPWIEKVANEPRNGLTNRQRREWVRKERRMQRTPIDERFFQAVVKALRQADRWEPFNELKLKDIVGVLSQ
jgi:hypothetical protein